MKNFLAKDSFLISTMDQKQKGQSLFLSLALIVFFLLSAFTFFNAFYGFVDAIGSIVSGSPDVAIKDLIRSLPLILTALMGIWTLLLLQASFRNDPERRLRSIKKDAIVILAFAGINILYVLIGRFAGLYLSLVEGSPSAIYPLDSVLYSLLYVALGVFTLLYLAKWQEKHPYLVPSRTPIVKKARFVYCFGVGIWFLIALYSCAAFLFGLFIIDFAHSYAFYSVCLLLVFLTASLSLAIWEFYYNELKEEKKKEVLLPLAICGLAWSVLVDVLYFVSLGLNLDGPSNIGFGLLPVAFAASVNIATMLVVFTPAIVSLVALIKGILIRRK